jgi:integrase
MATLNKLPSGYWRAQVRRKGQYVSRSYRIKVEAETWAIDAERALTTGMSTNSISIDRRTSFGTLIEVHIKDSKEIGRPLLRSKAMCLEKLKSDLGREKLIGLTRERLIAYGKARANQGAGPVTLAMDLGYIRTILVHAAAVHGVEVPTEQVTLARIALRRLGLVGKGDERDRRPTQNELDLIIDYYENNPRQMIPLGRLVKFAVATAMRQSEICSLLWNDVDLSIRIATVRNRKDPRRKSGNDQRVPLLDATGYDAVALLIEQRALALGGDRVFPYNGRSLGTAFRRICRELKISDLRFHDLRHEATSRLFEAGFDIPEVALVTGHKDWKMLRRYLNLQPHQLVTRAQPPRRYD